MRRPAYEEIRRPYRLVLAVGVVGALILLGGAVEFFHYEPPFQTSGLHARVDGIYAYDPKTREVYGRNLDHVDAGKPFAAVVDWSSLPPALQTAGRWYLGGFATEAGGAGPGPAASLPRIVPATTDRMKFPSGRYFFVVERWSHGRPVEVLARLSVIVGGP